MTDAPKAAVTGAAGFLGRAVVARLAADGWMVRQLVRTPPAKPVPHGEVVVGRLADEDALLRLVEGCEVVVHAAAVNRARRADEYYEVNVEGAYGLGRAVRKAAPAARVVAVSSLAARFPWLSPYAASKADGEDALVEAAATHAWAVLRLGPLYGAGDRKTLTLMEAATWPIMPVPDRPQARMSLLHVTDAAAAVSAACGPGPSGVVWEVGEGSRSWDDVVRAVIRAVSGTPRVLKVSPRLLALGMALTHPLGSPEGPLLSPGRLAELFHDDWIARPTRQMPAGLWRARVTLDTGLYEAAEWFRINGWLPPPVPLAATGQRG